MLTLYNLMPSSANSYYQVPTSIAIYLPSTSSTSSSWYVSILIYHLVTMFWTMLKKLHICKRGTSLISNTLPLWKKEWQYTASTRPSKLPSGNLLGLGCKLPWGRIFQYIPPRARQCVITIFFEDERKIQIMMLIDTSFSVFFNIFQYFSIFFNIFAKMKWRCWLIQSKVRTHYHRKWLHPPQVIWSRSGPVVHWRQWY